MNTIKSLTRAEINLNSLEYNLNQIRKRIPEGKKLLCVVKADAYGHGAVEVTRFLEDKGVEVFAVACLKEAAELRHGGVKSKIIIFGGVIFGEAECVAKYDVVPVIYSKEIASELNKEAERAGRKIKVNVEIDTGMGRLGISASETDSFFSFLSELKYIEVEGVMMHFAEADSVDDAYTMLQLSRFDECREKIDSITGPADFHAANSAAFLKYPDTMYAFSRIGLMLYGYKPCIDNSTDISLHPVMTLKSVITFIKEVNEGNFISYGRTYKCREKMKIATIGCGYADGLSRKLSNNFSVLLHGQYAPVVGRVCMDQTMIDVTNISEAKIGDEVVLMGSAGGKMIGADEIAERIDTIPYEVLCSVGKRVDRIYVGK